MPGNDISVWNSTEEVDSCDTLMKGVVELRKGDPLQFYPYTDGHYKAMGEDFCKKYARQYCTVERIVLKKGANAHSLQVDVRFGDGFVRQGVITEAFNFVEVRPPSVAQHQVRS